MGQTPRRAPGPGRPRGPRRPRCRRRGGPGRRGWWPARSSSAAGARSVDSTPPSDVACTHSEVERVHEVGRVGAAGEHDARRCRRSRGSGPRAIAGCVVEPPRQLGRRCSRPARPAACRVRSPRSASHDSSVPGIAPTRSRRPLSTSYSCVVGGHHGAEHDVGVTGEVLGRGVHDEVGAQRRAAAGSSGVAKVLSTTT